MKDFFRTLLIIIFLIILSPILILLLILACIALLIDYILGKVSKRYISCLEEYKEFENEWE